MAVAITTVIFDLGGVLIDWNPRYLYRRLLGDDENAVQDFLANICTQKWNEQQDAGRSFAEAEAVLKAVHPGKAQLIEAWLPGFNEMMSGAIEGSVSVLSDLQARGVPLYALTNWSAETFPVAQRRFDFLQWFRGIVMSGEEKLIKPDPRIYQILLARYNLDAAASIYIDDNAANVEAARELGFTAIHFVGAEDLRRRIAGAGLLDKPKSEIAV